jgi:hypothetical protein
MIRLALAVTLALLPGLAAAQDFSGLYQLGACNPSDLEGRIAISGASIQFYESTCQLANPVAVRYMGDATLFDVVCSGEGETWSYRALMMRGQEGLIMVRQGYALTYQRCG